MASDTLETNAEAEEARMFALYQPVRSNKTPPVQRDEIVVRPATPEDAEALARITQEREGGELSLWQERLQRELADRAFGVTNLLLVAIRETQLVGLGRVRYFQPASNAPANTAPPGWYLAGVIVSPAFRRRGIGALLTQHRLEWLAERATEAFYFVNAQNRASIDLHTAFHFEEVTRDFSFPGASFQGGVGILYRVALSPPPPSL